MNDRLTVTPAGTGRGRLAWFSYEASTTASWQRQLITKVTLTGTLSILFTIPGTSISTCKNELHCNQRYVDCSFENKCKT